MKGNLQENEDQKLVYYCCVNEEGELQRRQTIGNIKIKIADASI
jgi:hypothetical protein